MEFSNGEPHSRYVRRTFERIAKHYDLLNRLMTLGRDRTWRRETVRRLQLGSDEATILDIGAGTGDLANEVICQNPIANVVACDLTPEMVAIGKAKVGVEGVHWVIADAQELPFSNNAFDGVVSGFLLRNVTDVAKALSEQTRVLAPGGGVACLDTTPIKPGPLRPLLSLYFNRVIPTLGGLLAGNAEAYHYLPKSTARFLNAEDLAKHMKAVGLAEVKYIHRMFNTIAIHWGTKPSGLPE